MIFCRGWISDENCYLEGVDLREVPFEAKRRYYFVEVDSLLWQKLQIDSGIWIAIGSVDVLWIQSYSE